MIFPTQILRKHFSFFIVLICISGCPLHSHKNECRPLETSIYVHCQDILIEGLRSDSFWARMHAAEGLTEMGYSHLVLPVLSKMLDTEDDDQKRCGLAREMVRAGDEHKISILVDILSDPESNGRVHAAESLFKLQRIGNLELMIGLANNIDNSKVRLWTCAALISAGHKEYLSALRRFLDSTDPLEKAHSAYLLGQLGDEKVLSRIRKDIKQVTEPLHVFFYTAAIVYMNDLDETNKLHVYLDNEDGVIRALSAYTAGAELICNCQKKLISLLDDPEDDVRIRSAHALLNMRMSRKFHTANCENRCLCDGKAALNIELNWNIGY